MGFKNKTNDKFSALEEKFEILSAAFDELSGRIDDLEKLAIPAPKKKAASKKK